MYLWAEKLWNGHVGSLLMNKGQKPLPIGKHTTHTKVYTPGYSVAGIYVCTPPL